MGGWVCGCVGKGGSGEVGVGKGKWGGEVWGWVEEGGMCELQCLQSGED